LRDRLRLFHDGVAGRIDHPEELPEPESAEIKLQTATDFRGETDESTYVWLRRFNSEAEREALYKAVYDTDHRKTRIGPRVPECLDREKMHIQRIVPTPKSTAQWRSVDVFLSLRVPHRPSADL
jgi:hypothetical protein